MRTTIKWSMNSMGNGFELIPTSNVRDTCLVFAPPGLNMSSGTYPVRSKIRGHHFQIQEMYSYQVSSRSQLVGLVDSSSVVHFLHLPAMHYRGRRGKLGAQQLVHGTWNYIRSTIMPWFDATYLTKNSLRMGSPSMKQNTLWKSKYP